MAAGLGAAEGSPGTGQLLPLAVLPEAGAGWRERHFWLERQNGGEQSTSVAGEDSALPWTQPRHPSKGVSVGALWPGRAPGHPSSKPPLLCLSPRIRAAAAQPRALRASPGGKLSCPLTGFILQCHSSCTLALQMGWEGFCSAGRFGGGWLCLSSTAGVKEQLPRGPWGHWDLGWHCWGRAISQDAQGGGRNKSRPVGLTRSSQV